MRRDWISREVTLEVVVGAFLFMMLVAMAYFTIILGAAQFFREGYDLEVIFSDVMGLSDGDAVIVRGMPLGKVRDIQMKNDGVHVSCWLERMPDLRTDYQAQVKMSGLLGGRELVIDEGSSHAPSLPHNGIIRGRKPSNLVTAAAELISGVKDRIETNRVVENLAEAIESIRDLAVGLRHGDGTLGKLLTDDALYRDASGVAADLKELSGRLVEGQGTIGRLLSEDDKLYRDAGDAVASAKEVFGRVAAGEGTMGRLFSRDDALYQDVAVAVAAIRDIVEHVAAGQGTIGKVVKEEGLYDEAKKTVEDIRMAIDDFRETTPVTTFTSILFGAF